MSRRKMLVQRLLPAVVSIGALAWVSRSIEFSTFIAALSWHVVGVLTPAAVSAGPPPNG